MTLNKTNWKHIEFKDGSNPYICKTDAEFQRIQKKYNLKKIKEGFYITLTQRKKIKTKGD